MPGTTLRTPLPPAHSRFPAAALLAVTLLGPARAAAEPDAAPTPPPAGRPRIALALSGGGARGIAHVGVLKALEEMRVPIDCVAGTSMGAIVGGLYASGMSPGEIEAEMLAVDWTDLFSDKPPRRDLAFRRKQDDTSDLIDLEVGINEGRFTLPRGLLAGQKIGATFETLTLHAAAIDDFDRLRLPFRAVATDIGTGGMVVLGSGYLPEAMRASMAIPGMVAPAEIDGRMLVDGGLTRNLPVDVARALCGGVVVAVDVSTPLLTPAQVRSIGDITLQVSGLLTHQNAEEQRRAADVLITPELGPITFADFRKAAAAIGRGEAAVRAAAGTLRPFALTDGGHAAWRERQRRPADAPPIVVDAVRIEGATRVDRRAMEPRIRSAAGAPADRQVLRDDLARLYDLGEFERVDFRLTREEREAAAGDAPPAAGAAPPADGAPAPATRTTLVFRPTDKPWGPNYLRFGVNFLNDFQGDTDFSVLGRLTRTRINALGAEWRTDGQFGETRRFSTEFYQPLDFTGTFFVVPRFNYSFFNSDVFDGDRNLATYRTRYLAGMLSLGAQIGRYGEVRLGAARGRVDARERIGPGTLPGFDGEIAGWTGRLVFDRLDDSNFPHGGRFFLLEAFLARRGLGSEIKYDKLSGGVVQVWSRGRHHAFVSLSAGTDLGSDIPFFDEYRMGGLFNLSGFREGQIRGQMFGVTRVGWYRRSGKLSGIFGRGIYVGAWLEAGNAWQTRDEISGDTLHTTGTAALGVDTFFGPLYFAYGRSDGGHDVFYLSLGRSLGGPRMFDL